MLAIVEKSRKLIQKKFFSFTIYLKNMHLVMFLSPLHQHFIKMYRDNVLLSSIGMPSIKSQAVVLHVQQLGSDVET